MIDEVVMGLLKDRDLRVVAVQATGLARKASELHEMESASGAAFAQGILASSLMTALQLQKSDARVNFQLECDGALRGMFVETQSNGNTRGYVKNPLVSARGNANAWAWRPVLGNSGYISVLRDQGKGEFFRSSVELADFDLSLDFERFFLASEQLEAAAFLEVLPKDGNPLGQVVGLLIQPLPSGDRQALANLRRSLREGGRLRELLGSPGESISASALLSKLFEGHSFEVTSRYPIQWHCPCSRERVLQSLTTLGVEDLLDLFVEQGKAEADCHFCNTRYVIAGPELMGLIESMKPAA